MDYGRIYGRTYSASCYSPYHAITRTILRPPEPTTVTRVCSYCGQSSMFKLSDTPTVLQCPCCGGPLT